MTNRSLPVGVAFRLAGHATAIVLCPSHETSSAMLAWPPWSLTRRSVMPWRSGSSSFFDKTPSLIPIVF